MVYGMSDLLHRCKQPVKYVLHDTLLYIFHAGRGPLNPMLDTSWKDLVVIPKQNRFLPQMESDTYGDFGQFFRA